MGIAELVKDIKDMKRFEEILGVLFSEEFGYHIDKLKLRRHLPVHAQIRKEKFQSKDIHPERIRLVFEKLGGAFLKLGQLLSLRPDLIPREYCEEFSKLQDHVKPTQFKEIRREIEKELGKKADRIRVIESSSLGSASIGQVHKGKLTTGETVVFKVQKPGAKEKFEVDIDILSKFALIIKNSHKELPFDPVEIVEEFKRYTENEFDFMKEGKNLDLFYNNFFSSNEITVPKAHLDMTTKKVLVMQYVRGDNIRELAKEGVDIKYKNRMMRSFLSSMLVQIMDHGFFHADPHPGNLFFHKYNLIFLDFGIMGHLSEDDRREITRMFVGVITKNVKDIVRALAHIGVTKQEIDRNELEIDIRSAFGQYYNTTIDKIELSNMLYNIIEITRKHNMKMPSHFVLLAKALGTTESVIEEIDPDFNLIKESKKISNRYIKKKLISKETALSAIDSLTKVRDFVTSLPDKAEDVTYKIDKFNDNITLIHKDMNRLSSTIDKSVKTITLSILFFGVLAVGYLLKSGYSVIFYITAGLILVLLLYDLLKKS